MTGAVDIGGTKIAVGMVNDSGQVLYRQESPTDAASYASGLAAISRFTQPESNSERCANAINTRTRSTFGRQI